MTRRTVFTAACLWLAALLPLRAADKPNFTGEWTVDASKSDFGPLPPPAKFVRKIVHNDPSLTIATTQQGPQGEVTRESKYTTDGKETINHAGSTDVKTVATWVGDSLQITNKANTPSGAITSVETWTLAPDGKTMTANSTLAGPQGELALKLVLVKRAPDAAH